MASLMINKKQARQFILAQQNLYPGNNLAGKSGVLAHIRRVGCIQYDPLNIVGNNPELVLQARVRDFRPEMLQELLYEERMLVDGWDKNMSIYPMHDWPYFRRRKRAAKNNPGRSADHVKSVLPIIRRAIKRRGPLSSIDLDLDKTVDWSWAPTRLARAGLDSMYNWGELVIHHRIHTRKVYDFASRHIAKEILSAPDPNRTKRQFHDWYLLRRIGGVGLIWNRASDAWLGMYGKRSDERKATLGRLLRQGKVLELNVEDVKLPLYMRREDKMILDASLNSKRKAPQAIIIAPLDNLLWDRRLVEQLFDFSYVWEVYKPVSERRYGYYVLPILYGDRFIARFEPGRDKKSRAIIIKRWWWEATVNQTTALRRDLLRCFQQFIKFLGAEELHIEKRAAREANIDWLAVSAGS